MSGRSLMIIVCGLAFSACSDVAHVSREVGSETAMAFYAFDVEGKVVREVNAERTHCTGGSLVQLCAIDDIDVAPAGLSEEDEATILEDAIFGRLIVKGRVEARANKATLIVSEAWRVVSGSAQTKDIHFVVDNGVVCIGAPCFTATAKKLNTTIEASLSRVLIGTADASDEAKREALSALHEEGLIIGGKVVDVPMAGPLGDGREIRADQLYLLAGQRPAF